MSDSLMKAKPNYSQKIWIVTWIAIVVISALFQPGSYCLDAFKYVNIASNMITQHNYILPYYQNHPYSDKGPLMFWFFILGWKFTGINLWWPQLLIGLVATASLVILLKLAEALWPDQSQVKQLLPIVLLGLPSWIVLSNEIRVDIFLLFFVLSGLLSLLYILQEKENYWWIYAISLTFGFLSKGPVILLYTTLPAILIPFMLDTNIKKNFNGWYGALLSANLVAITFALIWAIPAAMQGASQYSHAIFFNQVYHRIFEHDSFFYYILQFPLIWLPWAFYMPFILGSLKYSKWLNGEKLCWLVIAITIVIFTFYGQKRIHYIDPDFPLIALIIARAISNYMAVNPQPKLSHQWFLSVGCLIVAAIILLIPHLSLSLDPTWHNQLFYFLKYHFLVAKILVVLAIVYFVYHPKTIEQQMIMIMMPTAVISTALIVLRVAG